MQALKTTAAATGNFIWNLGVPQVAFLTGTILNEASKTITRNNFSDIITQLPKHGLETLKTLSSVAGACLNSMTDVDLLEKTVTNNKELFVGVAALTIMTLGMCTLANKISKSPTTPTVCSRITSVVIPVIAFSASVWGLSHTQKLGIFQQLVGPTATLNFANQIKASAPATAAVVATAAIASQIPFVSLKLASGVAATLGYVANKVSALTNGATDYLPSFKWPRFSF